MCHLCFQMLVAFLGSWNIKSFWKLAISPEYYLICYQWLSASNHIFSYLWLQRFLCCKQDSPCVVWHELYWNAAFAFCWCFSLVYWFFLQALLFWSAPTYLSRSIWREKKMPEPRVLAVLIILLPCHCGSCVFKENKIFSSSWQENGGPLNIIMLDVLCCSLYYQVTIKNFLSQML